MMALRYTRYFRDMYQRALVAKHGLCTDEKQAKS